MSGMVNLRTQKLKRSWLGRSSWIAEPRQKSVDREKRFLVDIIIITWFI